MPLSLLLEDIVELEAVLMDGQESSLALYSFLANWLIYYEAGRAGLVPQCISVMICC